MSERIDCSQCSKSFTRKGLQTHIGMAHNPRYQDKEWLKEQYYEKRKSMREIGDECGVSYDTIWLWMNKFGLKRRKHTKKYWKDDKTRTCLRCGRTLPITEFYKNGRDPSGRQKWCKDCIRDYRKRNNDFKRYQRAYVFIHRRVLQGAGICIYCGETNPFKLEVHHIFGRENSNLPISLCGSHHRLLHSFPKMLENEEVIS